MSRITVRALVKGRVQGVSFRAAMQVEAQRHSVAGWVRNNADGSVEALLQGEEEKIAILLAWAGRGPPSASVTSVSTELVDSHPHHRGFEIIE